MHRRYIKTEAGLREMAQRSLGLPRTVRNLLLVINDGQPAQYWLNQVQGVGPDDLAQLLQAGLIAAIPDDSPRAAPPQMTPAQEWVMTLQAVHAAQAQHLSDTIKTQAQQFLDDAQAYRLALALEDAEDSLELTQSLARGFLAKLRETQGMAPVMQVCRALLSGPRRSLRPQPLRRTGLQMQATHSVTVAL